MAQARPVALVTGASRGIGRSTALALAGAGYDVAINYASSRAAAEAAAREAEALGAWALPVQADVADEDAVAAMTGRIRAAFGRLDALVNNAGTTIKTPPADLDGLDMADWDRVFAVNVRGLFQVTRACVPLLRRAPGGHGGVVPPGASTAPGAAIVNLASIAGLRPGPQPFPYAASKAAVANLTRTLAGRLGPEGIRVNAVAPGWMSGEWMQDQLGENYDRLMERRARLTPLRRCVTPDEVARTIVSLITSNPFVTGEIVVIDGGFTATT
jgi:3-oxoacyl-[acyl-carrier protein] reductase